MTGVALDLSDFTRGCIPRLLAIWRHSFFELNPLLRPPKAGEREIFIDNLLVRVHLIIEMILVDRPCATGV